MSHRRRASVIGNKMMMMMMTSMVVAAGMRRSFGLVVGMYYASSSRSMAVVAGRSQMMDMWIGIGCYRSRSWRRSENRTRQTCLDWFG